VAVSSSGFGLLLAGLVLVAGAMYRGRVRRLRAEEATTLNDALVRQIEEQGFVDVDDPLDHQTIQEEEARFWEDEPWEESEEW
jgi:hypothetical protein